MVSKAYFMGANLYQEGPKDKLKVVSRTREPTWAKKVPRRWFQEPPENIENILKLVSKRWPNLGQESRKDRPGMVTHNNGFQEAAKFGPRRFQG